MNIKSALTILFLFFITGRAFAIDPAYEGTNGIREQVFATNCLACHSSGLTGSARNGAPSSVNWDTYEATIANASRAIVRAVDQMTMPPSFSGLPLLNETQRTAMLAWQSAGFPRAAAIPTPVANYSFDSTILTLPVVNVGDQKFNATFRLSSTCNPNIIGFALESAELTTASLDNAATFSSATGKIVAPLVQLVQNGASQGQLSVELTLITNSNPLQFVLTNSTVIP
jgi:mono/diheme cytochrome c family protein